jgi:hypothetical protein
MLWGKNGRHAASLAVARINLFKTGKEQLKSVLGILDCQVRIPVEASMFGQVLKMTCFAL